MLRYLPLLFLALNVAARPAQPVLDWEPRSDWMNVREAGAVGDGRTDDTAAIQSALDQVTDGSTVYFPPGTYRLTDTVSIVGPLTGVQVIGHGAATVLAWHGPADGKVFRDDGMAYSRIVGLCFEGAGKAAVGYWHDSHNRFETEVRHQHLAFRGFTDAAILAEPADKFALAETTFENCLFEDCYRGVAFLRFNDYNYTFNGCFFRRCTIGIHCAHGNFFVRDCRFEESVEVDIKANPEHGSSVRRTVSVGSRAFLHFGNPVTPMTVEECLIADWQAPEGTVRTDGAPFIMVGCRFTNGPEGAPPLRVGHGQRVILAGNRSTADLLPADHRGRVYEVPGEFAPPRLTRRTHFLTDSVAVPKKVFDAKRDFGAVGDGKADDTAAIQAAIDAARAHGNDAIAYLPTGFYRVTETLNVTGGGYRIGGTGFRTRVRWAGEPGGTLMAIREPGDLTLEHLCLGIDAGEHAADIVQYGTETGSRVVYDGVFCYGLYKEEPDRQGLHCRDLGPRDIVNMPHVQGNLQFHECGDAVILGTCTYEGAITVTGAQRGGFLGFMTRLTTHNRYSIYLRDNNSLVLSDYYIEQSDNGISLAGTADSAPGMLVVGLAKIGFTIGDDPTGKATALHYDGYRGDTFVLGGQFYTSPEAMFVDREGDIRPDLYVVGSSFYKTRLAPRPAAAVALHLLGCHSRGVVTPDSEEPGDWPAADVGADAAMRALPAALRELRYLGGLDLRLNHPGVCEAE